MPLDPYDLSKGWSELDTSGGGGIKETPKSLGLKDVSAIAFAVANGDASEFEFWVEEVNMDELYPEEDA